MHGNVRCDEVLCRTNLCDWCLACIIRINKSHINFVTYCIHTITGKESIGFEKLGSELVENKSYLGVLAVGERW